MSKNQNRAPKPSHNIPMPSIQMPPTRRDGQLMRLLAQQSKWRKRKERYYNATCAIREAAFTLLICALPIATVLLIIILAQRIH